MQLMVTLCCDLCSQVSSWWALRQFLVFYCEKQRYSVHLCISAVDQFFRLFASETYFPLFSITCRSRDLWA